MTNNVTHENYFFQVAICLLIVKNITRLHKNTKAGNRSQLTVMIISEDFSLSARREVNSNLKADTFSDWQSTTGDHCPLNEAPDTLLAPATPLLYSLPLSPPLHPPILWLFFLFILLLFTKTLLFYTPAPLFLSPTHSTLPHFLLFLLLFVVLLSILHLLFITILLFVFGSRIIYLG